AFAAAFSQHENGIDFTGLDARLGSAKGTRGAAGSVRGNGRYAGGALDLTLRTERLNLQRIDPQLRATRLAGQAELRHTEGRQTFSVALTEPLGNARIALDAEGVLTDTELEIRTLALRAGK